MSTKHTRHHRRSKTRRYKSHTKKNILQKSTKFVTDTSKKIMPQVKQDLEKVGSNVITKTQESIPYLQKLTRRFFSLFTRKNRN